SGIKLSIKTSVVSGIARCASLTYLSFSKGLRCFVGPNPAKNLVWLAYDMRGTVATRLASSMPPFPRKLWAAVWLSGCFPSVEADYSVLSEQTWGYMSRTNIMVSDLSFG
ncbi:MAG: hypothetical protein ACKPKO_06530, partial [Candidatus Fonsibacter sp.]